MINSDIFLVYFTDTSNRAPIGSLGGPLVNLATEKGYLGLFIKKIRLFKVIWVYLFFKIKNILDFLNIFVRKIFFVKNNE